MKVILHLRVLGKMLYNLPGYLFSSKITKLTLTNIKAYYKGNLRLIDFKNLPIHIQEQFYYRVVNMNYNCLQNGMCPCECPFPEKQLADEPCEKQCYMWMVDKNIWDSYCISKEINITFVKEKALVLLKQKGIFI